MKYTHARIYVIFFLMVLIMCPRLGLAEGIMNQKESWIKIDDFEAKNRLSDWTKYDAQNDTVPHLKNPQVTEIRSEQLSDNKGSNRYLIKKAGPDGVFGNRKALSFRKLPKPIGVGDTYTLYLRLNIESYSNNHVFGLTNLQPAGIMEKAYEAFEPSLRITDRFDPHVNYQNNGAMQVRNNPWYDIAFNAKKGKNIEPFDINTWYEIWAVINNKKKSEGGQQYDVYIRGGTEFPFQQKVYTAADFRIKRELPLIYFQATCNSGPIEEPFGNGGLRYDDLYMVKGIDLSTPVITK